MLDFKIGKVFRQIATAPQQAWRYSQQHPLEAFVYGGICLFFAVGAKIFLSVLAFCLMGGAVCRLLNRERL